MPTRKPVVVDLFSGAGGFSLGFHAAGAQIAAAVDFSEAAGETLSANFALLQPDAPPLVLCGDEGNIEDLDFERVLPATAQPDILIGGPPCQGFSRIGRAKLASLADDGDEGDPRNELYRRFLDAVRYWRPRAVVMENVPGMASLRGVDVAEQVARELAQCGYRVGYAVLNAAWYGVPQFRERLFFVGFRNDLDCEPVLPRMTHQAPLPVGYLRPRGPVTIPFSFVPHYRLAVTPHTVMSPGTSVAEALDDLPVLQEHLSAVRAPRREDFRIRREYATLATSRYAQLMRGWTGMPIPDHIDDHVARRTPRDYETFRRMKAEDRYPEALAIAERRFEEALEDLQRAGVAPLAGSPSYQELKRSIVPPYPPEKFVDKWRKLNPSTPSWTVTAHLAKDAYSHIHHDAMQARAISVREAARLQSFPDAFRFHGNMGDCFAQIGNAVPPLLSWAVAAEVLFALNHAGERPNIGRS